jgi:hypothetical protein
MLVVGFGAVGWACAGEPEELYCTSGIWPDSPMRSGLHTTNLELDASPWTEDISTRELIFRLYAVVGASKPTAKSFVVYQDQTLKLGGDAPHESASVIWKFAAPEGNAFAGGTVTIEASVASARGDVGNALFGAVGENLELTGGGAYLRPFSGYDRKGFTAVPFDSSKGQEAQRIQLNIPRGSVFYVAVTRDELKDAEAQLVIRSLTVEPTFRDPRGMTIHFDREEPLWSVGENVQFRIGVTGEPTPKAVVWTLSRDGEMKPNQNGQTAVVDGAAVIDLSQAPAGFWTLSVADESGNPSAPLDTQQLVILRAQDASITHGRSIFGAFEAIGYPDVARRMGVKWDVMVRHWYSGQPTPDSIPEFSMEDSAAKARDNGFEPIVLIGNAPSWANDGQPEIVPPLDAFHDEWKTFNESVARAYRGRVTWYQSWNEPNNPFAFQFGSSQSERREKAKQLQRLQFEGIKAGDPNAKLIGGCFAGVPASEFAEWLREPFSTLKFQDAMSGHSYCKAIAEENYRHKYPPEPTLVPEILEARKAMDEGGAADQPMFWTEYGWQTEHVTDDQQARWQARHMVIMQAYKDKTRTLADCVFSFNPDSGYGIMRHPRGLQSGEHRYRSAVGAYATVASLLAGSVPLEPISDHPENVRAYVFRKGDRMIYAIWATEDSRVFEIRLPLKGTKTVTRVGLLGDETAETFDFSNPYPLPKNCDPVYLIDIGGDP